MLLWLGNRRGGVWNRRPEAIPFVIHRGCFLFLKALSLAPNDFGRKALPLAPKYFRTVESCREGGQSWQVAEDVVGADGQLVVRLPLKVFASTCKKVQRRSWTDGDPPMIKSETLKNSVWSKEENVESEPEEEVPKKRISLQVR